MSKLLLVGIVVASVSAYGLGTRIDSEGRPGRAAPSCHAARAAHNSANLDPRLRVGRERLPLEPAAMPRPTAPACSDAARHQLDFWIGDWRVTDSDGQSAGTSHVRALLDHCVLREEWTSGELHGTSLTTYDAPERTWRQMWVDDHGGVLRLSGVWSDGRMVMRGTRVGSDGRSRQLRMSLAPDRDGSVEQLLERSEDDGRTWTELFRGTYRRASGESRPQRPRRTQPLRMHLGLLRP